VTVGSKRKATKLRRKSSKPYKKPKEESDSEFELDSDTDTDDEEEVETAFVDDDPKRLKAPKFKPFDHNGALVRAKQQRKDSKTASNTAQELKSKSGAQPRTAKSKTNAETQEAQAQTRTKSPAPPAASKDAYLGKPKKKEPPRPPSKLEMHLKKHKVQPDTINKFSGNTYYRDAKRTEALVIDLLEVPMGPEDVQYTIVQKYIKLGNKKTGDWKCVQQAKGHRHGIMSMALAALFVPGNYHSKFCSTDNKTHAAIKQSLESKT
jgi:hypothetical protein